MNAQQQRYYDEITVLVAAKGGRVISTSYEKMINKMVFGCANGHVWDTEARSIFKNMWCRYCHGNTRENGEANLRQRVADKGGIVLGQYNGNHVKILLQCKLGHQWEPLPYNISVGKWCDVCGYKKKPERFFKRVQDRKGTVLDTYIDSRTKIRVQCEHGHIWRPVPSSVVTGQWCSFCAGSSGENAIASYLDEHHIAYTSQTTIPPLPRRRYDFIIEDQDRKVIIEYDGEQHFRYISHYHVDENFFRHRQAVDRVKTLNALTNGFRVIRIAYTDINDIRSHLDTALSKSDVMYVSKVDLYQGWFLGAPVPQSEYDEVVKGHSHKNTSKTPHLVLRVLNTS